MEKIKGFLKSKWAKRILAVVLIFAVGFGIFQYISKKKKSEASTNEETVQTATVIKSSIRNTISGSGTVSPIERYDIVPLVRGDILKSPFDVGDYVKKDDLLYEIDHEDADINIEKMQNNIKNQRIALEETLKDIRNLTIYAPASGQLTDFTLKVGEQAGKSKIGKITDVNTLIAKVPFNSSQISHIKEGQKATIGIEKFMMNVEGTVVSKSSVSQAQSLGAALYEVEIKLSNPGAIPVGTMVTATVHTPSGDMVSPAAGAIEYPEPVSLMSESSGTVKKVYVKNNDWVEKGQKIAELENDSLINSYERAQISLRDSELNLESSKKSLDNYYIKSPIDGVVITKNYKAGDTIEGTQSTTLMVVADMSKMIFTINVDELDIAKIKLEQKVEVEADALPDEKFEGRVTKIASEGVSQNGVTTYAVEVTIDEPRDLLPGMNVSAEIIIEESFDTLVLPIEAVGNIQDGYGIVYVKSDGTQTEGQPGGPSFDGQGPRGQRNEGQVQDGTGSQQGQRPQFSQGDGPQGQRIQGAMPQRVQGNGENQGRQGRGNLPGGFGNFPEGTVPKRVKVGIKNDSQIEILEGLSEGDEVYYFANRASNFNQMPFMAPGGMGGGGARMQVNGPPAGGPRF